MKTMFRKLLGGVMVTIGFAALTACGGGGGGSAPAAPAPATAQGSFSSVTGLGYTSGSLSGTTSDTGTYTYVVGSQVKFTVGDIAIGEAPAAAVMTSLNLVPLADATSVQALNVERFILSVGSYDPATGKVTIPTSVINAAKGKTLDFTTVTDVQLLEMVKLLTGNGNAVLVDAAVAKAALEKAVYAAYAGPYQGSFSGPASSTQWTMTLNPDGTIVGRGLDGARESVSGRLSDGVNFQASAIGDCLLTGKLNLLDGTITGSWYYKFDPTRNGTFTVAVAR